MAFETFPRLTFLLDVTENKLEYFLMQENVTTPTSYSLLPNFSNFNGVLKAPEYPAYVTD
jgi:hypothetical protein